MGGTLENAGILLGGKLTSSAKSIFVNRVKLALLTGAIPLPFGSTVISVPTRDFSKNIDIGNSGKFPEFQKLWIDGFYESAANSLNFSSNFALPLLDPAVLADQLKNAAPPWTAPSPQLPFPLPLPIVLDALLVPPAVDPTTTAVRASYIDFAISLVSSKPPSPSFDLSLPGDFNYSPFGALDVKNKLGIIIPLSFSSVFALIFAQILANPTIALGPILFSPVIDYSFINDIIGIFKNGPFDTPPVTALAASAALASVIAEAIAFSALGSVIGSGVIVKTAALSRGYT